MTAIDATCLWCGDELPVTAKATIQYCSVNHRVAAWRERQRTVQANKARFKASAIDHELRKRAAEIDPRDFIPPEPSWTPPPLPPPAEPELLDEFDRWFRAPLHLTEREG